MVEVKGVSEQEEDISRLGQEELSEQELKTLVNKALNNGEHEAMFILVLSEWSRPGSSFSDYGKFQVLYGEIEKIFMNHVYDYPTTNEYTYAIIPKSKAVVLLHESGDDYQGKLQKYAKLYIFTYATGWKSLDLD